VGKGGEDRRKEGGEKGSGDGKWGREGEEKEAEKWRGRRAASKQERNPMISQDLC
jgi:hypothetical protein